MVTCPKCKVTVTGLYFTMNKEMTELYYQCPCGHKWSEEISAKKKGDEA